MDDYCEVAVRNEWVSVPIEQALRLHPERVKRCPECHGRVRAHRESVDGMRAHFEHYIAHRGCSRSVDFDGKNTVHPRAIG